MKNETTIFSKHALAPYYDSSISLTPLQKKDLIETLRWRNYYRKWFLDEMLVKLENHLSWYEDYMQKTNDFVFIVRDEVKNAVGQVAIYNVNWLERVGEFGRFVVNPDFSGRGYMKKACCALLKLCSELFDLQRISLVVKSNNARAIEIYKNCGFMIRQLADNTNMFMDYYNSAI